MRNIFVRLQAETMGLWGTRKAGETSCAGLDDAEFWTTQPSPFISPLEGHVLMLEDSAISIYNFSVQRA